jgi:hypothetical protein
MKILNILVFGILITTNVHAGGVYGTLYDSSDLVAPKGQFDEDQNKITSEAKKEKERRAKQEEAQRLTDQAFDEKMNKLRR